MRQSTVRTITGLCLMVNSATARLTGQEQQHPPSQPISDTGATPLYDNLGTLHKDITTVSEVTQK